ncbi:MAG: anaerobic ribonucleoside-triphosphate reductase activating protein [Methanomassiliicoccales archaeon]|jgi:pyruvate formate lyase activating enzyme
MKIVGFAKTSLLDWDGCVAATVYIAGCNFRCPFCHNRDLVLNPENLEEIPLTKVQGYLESNKEFLDGIVITGGEPTIHAELPNFVKVLRDSGMEIKLDTNGSNPEMIEDLLDAGLLNYIAMDLKSPVNSKYSDLIGVSAPLEKIKKSILLIMDSSIDYEFRTTVVPVLLTEKEIEAMAAYIGGARKYTLQQFRPKNTIDTNLTVIDPYPTERLQGMADIARQYVKKVVVRGEI